MDMSLPSRERGLKSNSNARNLKRHPVAPFAGAWIEICEPFRHGFGKSGRSLRGSVD